MTRPLLQGVPEGMDPDDAALLDRALALLEAAYVAGQHEVATAVRTADGGIEIGIHVDGTARRSGVCAEGVAIGNAVVTAAERGRRPEIVSVVSVLRRRAGTRHIIEPCGVCAELLTDYWPAARVWVTEGERAVAVPAASLIPFKRIRESPA